MESDSKICLDCARLKLAKKKVYPCGDCTLLNVDRLAKVRANAARPSPLQRFKFLAGYTSLHLNGSASTFEHRPARPRWGGGDK